MRKYTFKRPIILSLLTLTFLLLNVSIANAGNWLPLPPLIGPDPGSGQNSWFPAVDATCTALTMSMESPSTPIDAYAPADAVQWRLTGVYDISGAPIALSDLGDGVIATWTTSDNGTTFSRVFTFSSALPVGTRLYTTVQNRISFEGTYGNWSDDVSVGDSSYSDFYARAYVPASSNGRTALSCGVDLTTAPTASINDPLTTSAPEGDSGESVYSYAINLSAPSSQLVTARVTVAGSQSNDSGGPISYDATEGEDFAVRVDGVDIPNTLTYRVPYPFGCSFGGTYCDLGIDEEPPFMAEVVFAPGETSKIVDLVIYGDSTLEEDESIWLQLSDVSNANRDATTSYFTNQDDDQPNISVLDATHDECTATGENTAVNVTVQLNKTASVPTGIYYTITPGSGNSLPSEDFVPIFEPVMGQFGPVTMASVSSGALTTTIPVTVVNDTIDEATETILVDIGIPNIILQDPRAGNYYPVDGLGNLVDRQAVVTILPNGPDASIGTTASTVEGSSGQTNMTFTITMNRAAFGQGGNPNDPRQVNFYWETYQGAGDTATPGVDYVASSGTATVAANATSTTFNVPIIGDSEFEADETFSVRLTGTDRSCLQTTEATGTITNDDTSINITNASANEADGTMTFTVTVDEAKPTPITFDYATSNGSATAGADYTATTSNVTIAANATSTTITVPILDDLLDEGDETFTVTLSNVVGAGIGNGSASGLITDDDTTLNITDASATELESEIVFTVSLLEVPGRQIVFDYATSNGSAIAGTDYTAISGTGSIASDAISTTITVPLIDNFIDQQDRAFSLTISNVQGADSGNLVATGDILDDDTTIAIRDVQVNEAAGTVTITVAPYGPSPNTISFDYATSDGTAIAGQDYTSINGSSMITPETAPAIPTNLDIVVPILNDSLDEDAETFTLSLSNVVGASVSQSVTTITIIDDDTTLNVADASANEADGTLTFTVSLLEVPGREIVFDYATSDGTAIAGTHYTMTSGTGNIASDAISTIITVPLIDNFIDGPDRAFGLTISNVQGADSGDTEALGTIFDDDTTLNVADASANEADGTLTFTVSLLEVPGREITFDYATSDGTAIAGTDYTTTSGAGSIASDAISTTITVALIDNALDQNERTFTMTISNVQGADSGDTEALGTIFDDDTTLNVGDVQADEGNGMLTFTVALLEVPGREIVFDYATSDGTAIAGIHYTMTSGAGSIASDSTSTTISVPIFDDDLANLPRTFTLTISNVQGAASGMLVATGTIADNDELQPQPINLNLNADLTVAPIQARFEFTHQGDLTGNFAASEWYNLQIFRGSDLVVDRWLARETICAGIYCAFPFVDRSNLLPNGPYTWQINTWTPTTTTSSAVLNFEVNIGVPVVPVIESVEMLFGQQTVFFNNDPAATWFQLSIVDETDTLVFDGWQQKLALCPAGTCRFAVSTPLLSGSYAAYMRAWGPNDLTEWSAAYNFTVNTDVPALPQNLSVDNVALGQPSFSWQSDANAQWYQLWVGPADYSSTIYNQWISAAGLNCNGACTFAPNLDLSNGDYVWWLQAWGAAGYNNNDDTLWAEGPAFSVNAPVPTLPNSLSADVTDGSGILTWNGDANATWYQLWLGQGGNTLVFGWYSAERAGCAGGTNCFLTPEVSFDIGLTYDWSLQAWGPGGFNNGDADAWASSSFSVPTANTPALDRG